MMACCEWFEAEDGLKFSRVLSRGFGATAVVCPHLHRDLKLVGYR